MTAEAIIEAHDGSAGVDGEAVGGQVVALPAPLGTTVPSRSAVRSWAVEHARDVVPLLAGVGAAIATQARPLVAGGVLVVWMVTHLLTDQRRVGRALPGVAQLAQRMAVPLAAAALAVLVGVMSRASVTDAFTIALVATAGLLATAVVVEGRRRPRRVLVVGDRARIGHLAATWGSRRDIDVVGAAVVDEEAEADEPDVHLETFGLPTTRGVDDVRTQVERLHAEAVVVLPAPGVGSAEIRRLGWELEDTGTALAVCTDLGSAAPHRLAFSRIGQHTLVEVAPSRPPLHVRVAKCVIDRVGAAVLLTVLAPLLLTLVALVRLESRGPGFFTQTRVGKGGRPFKVYKLRTMCVQAEEIKSDLHDVDEGNGVLFKVRQDPRITRIGRPLRRTSLDELPQLFNVLRGEMSLVGPRPALPDEVAQYDATARRRLAVRPGITGLWQVSGRSDLDWETAVSLDVAYTDNVTITDDLRICLRTVGAVTSGKGAY
jgi:exopolysaccharide biosynthesis polyprenyl glycosylphosphotransferase